MPRRARVHVSGGIYHVVLRGNAREPIFFRAADRDELNALFAEGLTRYQCRLHAFCWMTNHLHAAIQVSDQPLSGLMCWLGSRYARYINRRRGRTGHLFERRHRAELVSDDEYLLSLVRYIHLNPVTAGLAVGPGQYPWSSHRCYLGEETLAWVTTRSILSCFASSVTHARRQYRQFMSTDTDWTPDPDTQVPAPEQERLADGELAMPSSSRTANGEMAPCLDDIVKTYCATAGLDPAVVVGPGRQRTASRVRGLICAHALSTGVATLSELAVYFGRAPEVISRGIAHYVGAATPTRDS